METNNENKDPKETKATEPIKNPTLLSNESYLGLIRGSIDNLGGVSVNPYSEKLADYGIAYDFDFTKGTFDGSENLIGGQQSGLEIVGKTFGGFIANGLAGVIAGEDYDVVGMAGMMAGSERKYGSFLAKAADDLREFSENNFKIYSTGNWGDANYWGQFTQNAAFSVGLMAGSVAEFALIEAATGGLGTGVAIGRAAGKVSKLRKAVNLVGKATAFGAIKGIQEGYQNGIETWKGAYDTAIKDGLNEKEAIKVASEAAALGYRTEVGPLMVLNALQFGLMAKMAKPLTKLKPTGFGVSDVVGGIAERVVSKNAPGFVKGAAGFAINALSEGVEELYQTGVSKYAQDAVRNDIYKLNEVDYFDEEMFESGLAGAITGGAFHAIGKASNYKKNQKYIKKKNEYFQTFFEKAKKENEDLLKKINKAKDPAVKAKYKAALRRANLNNARQAAEIDYEFGEESAHEDYVQDLIAKKEAVEKGDTETLKELGITTQEEIDFIKENYDGFIEEANEYKKSALEYGKNYSAKDALQLAAIDSHEKIAIDSRHESANENNKFRDSALKNTEEGAEREMEKVSLDDGATEIAIKTYERHPKGISEEAAKHLEAEKEHSEDKKKKAIDDVVTEAEFDFEPSKVKFSKEEKEKFTDSELKEKEKEIQLKELEEFKSKIREKAEARYQKYKSRVKKGGKKSRNHVVSRISNIQSKMFLANVEDKRSDLTDPVKKAERIVKNIKNQIESIEDKNTLKEYKEALFKRKIEPKVKTEFEDLIKEQEKKIKKAAVKEKAKKKSAEIIKNKHAKAKAKAKAQLLKQAVRKVSGKKESSKKEKETRSSTKPSSQKAAKPIHVEPITKKKKLTRKEKAKARMKRKNGAIGVSEKNKKKIIKKEKANKEAEAIVKEAVIEAQREEAEKNKEIAKAKKEGRPVKEEPKNEEKVEKVINPKVALETAINDLKNEGDRVSEQIISAEEKISKLESELRSLPDNKANGKDGNAIRLKINNLLKKINKLAKKKIKEGKKNKKEDVNYSPDPEVIERIFETLDNYFDSIFLANPNEDDVRKVLEKYIKNKKKVNFLLGSYLRYNQNKFGEKLSGLAEMLSLDESTETFEDTKKKKVIKEPKKRRRSDKVIEETKEEEIANEIEEKNSTEIILKSPNFQMFVDDIISGETNIVDIIDTTFNSIVNEIGIEKNCK